MQNYFGNKWIRAKSVSHQADIKAIVILVHGLNNQAKLMYPFAEEIAAKGYDVYIPVLDGHASDYNKFKSIDKDDWLCNIKAAYEIAATEALNKNCRLYYVGFSLGGLLGTVAKAEDYIPDVERMILLAPALEMTFFSSLMRPLLYFNLKFAIPSKAPGSYRAHPFLPIKAYRTLFELKDQLNENISKKINIPSLVFIDKKDELVSFKKLLNFISKNRLGNWEVKLLTSKKKKGIHHMIADPYYAGEQNWQLIVNETLQFFNAS